MRDDSDRLDRRTFLTAAGTGAASVTVLAARGGARDGVDGGADAESADRRQERRVAHEREYRQLDPHRYTRVSDGDVVAAVYDRPVARDGDGRIVGRLATEFTFDGDTGELAFTIRDDATFHDGTDLEPADVAYSMRRLSSESVGPNRSAETAFVDAVDAVNVDGDRVVLSLSTVDGSLLSRIARDGFVLSRAWDRQRDGFQAYVEANGTGAFELASYDSRTIRLARHDGHWDERAAPEAVELVTVANATDRAAAVETGELDLGARVGTAAASLPEERIAAGPGPTLLTGFMQNDSPPFDSRAFRRALNYAVDGDAVLESAWNGRGETVGQPGPSWFEGHAEDVDPYPHDPDRAADLVTESGYEGAEIELHVPETQRRTVLTGQVVVDAIDGLPNVSCSLVRRSFAGLAGEVVEEDRDASPAFYLLQWTEYSLDVGIMSESLLRSGSSLSMFHDDQLDDLLAAARTTTGEDRRESLTGASAYAHEEAALLFLVGTDDVHAVREDLPYRLRPDGTLDLAALGGSPPDFVIDSVSIPDSVVAGESTEVSVTVANTGSAAGEVNVTVTIARADGGGAGTTTVRLESGATETVSQTLTTEADDAGSEITVEFEVGDETVSERVAVVAPETTTAPATTASPTTTDSPTTADTATPGDGTTAGPETTAAGDEADGGDADDESDDDGSDDGTGSVPGFGLLATAAGLFGAAALRRRLSGDAD